jgi:hypothetical protein
MDRGKAPTPAVTINTAYYFIINALSVFCHNILETNIYIYLCQKRATNIKIHGIIAISNHCVYYKKV